MTNQTLTAAQLEERDYQELMANDKGAFGVTNRILGYAFTGVITLVGLATFAAQMNAAELNTQAQIENIQAM